MKKFSKSGWLLIIMATFLFNLKCFPQVSEIGYLMAAGAEDAEVLIQPYITPAVNAFGAALGSGWYNTAGTHSLGGFDITLTTNVAIIPGNYESFIIEDSKLTSLKLDNPSLNLSPTVAGEKTPGPMMDYNYDEYSANAFRMPQGLNTNYVPSPMLQVGIGLIKGTEVIVRYLPKVKYDENEIGFWGIGGKHDIKQWIPGLKKLPAMQLSLMYGYTKLNTLVNMEITPDGISAGSLPGANVSTWDNQDMKMITQSHTANLIVGANLPVVCFYGAVGFISTKTNLTLNGDFPSVGINEATLTPEVIKLTDPIDMEIKNQDGGVVKPRFNAGMRFKFAVITIHFDYTWANYSVVTAGLGVSVR
jgi:hypothetical protein